MVDLTRFPIDTEVVCKVPKDVAARHNMLPLMMDQERLIVAVDRPSRIAELRSLHLSVRTPIVPVLAPRLQITAALNRLSHDVWLQHVVDPATQFQTTG
jgi:type IV pilus assembly protein PilB